MLENDHQPCRRIKGRGNHQRGGAAVEFALLVIVFLTFVFGVLEIARAIYIVNILQEVTRRAGAIAANSNFDQGALDTIRSRALFADSRGNLVFGAPITPAHLKIDYFSIPANGSGTVTPQLISAVPSSPAQNYANCLANPHDSACIRLIRVRICQPGSSGDSCTAVPYQMQFPFIDMSALTLPRSETLVPANTLGYKFSE